MYGSTGGRIAGGFACLGLVITLSAGARWVAEVPDQPVRPLSVRPHAMATGTRTGRAGPQLLDSFPGMRRRAGFTDPVVPEDYSVYVPQQCVGTRRCPLLVNLYQGGDWRPMAETYGFIVLFLPNTIGNVAPSDSISQVIDAALTQVLRKYAIDPAKIAMSGTCGSGGQAYFWGRSNLHVFSRVIEISPENHFAVTTPPQSQRVRFYLVTGVDEQTGAERDTYSNYYLQNSLKSARELRRDGFREGVGAGAQVTVVLGIRDHVGRFEDYDYVGRWLHASWTPGATAEPAPVVVVDPLPVLTPDAVTRFTTFWTRFMQEPDSIREAGRLAHLRPIMIPVGTGRRASRMSDLGALAKAYPSVAADLKAVGLTAREAEAYRVALLSARATRSAGVEAGPVAASSVLGRNVAFIAAHAKELEALDQVHMWKTP